MKFVFERVFLIMVCSRYPKEYQYYERVLKKRCFRKLRNNVWDKKWKWKLLDRAEFHYEFKILRKYFDLWVYFINEKFIQKINYGLAVSSYEEKLKMKLFLELQRNVLRSKIFVHTVRHKINWNLKVRTWCKWKHYIQKKVKTKEIKFLANKIRQKTLVIRFINLWLFRLKERNYLKVS